MKAVLRVLLALLVLVAITGCSTFQHRDRLAAFNAAYTAGDYQSALNTVSVPEQPKADVRSHLLELLHQGEMYRLTGRYEEAIRAYDQAEAGMKYLDTRGTLASTTEGLLAMMVNDSARDYQALMAEAVLVNTYKGLAFLAAGNNEYARVEFNRANDRTRRAVDYFREEIAAQQASLRREAQQGNPKASLIRNSLGDKQFQSAVNRQYGMPSDWSVYSRFIVPFSTYLHGLYFFANAETGAGYERALTSLERVAQMNPNSSTLRADARLADRFADGSQNLAQLPPQVWIVYENGLGPVLEEVRLDVPLALVRGMQQAPAYVGVALPHYRNRSAVPGGIQVAVTSGQTARTERLFDMGKVVRTEMQERMPGLLTRALASAVSKSILQNEVMEQFGPWGQFFAAAYAMATTQADLRSWQALPDHWQALRIRRPVDGRLVLQNDQGKTLGSLTIPPQPFTLVYVKRPALQAPATVMVLDLQGTHEAVFRRMTE